MKYDNAIEMLSYQNYTFYISKVKYATQNVISYWDNDNCILIMCITLKMLQIQSEIKTETQNSKTKNIKIKNLTLSTTRITQAQCKKLHSQVFENSVLLCKLMSSYYSKHLQNRTDKK